MKPRSSLFLTLASLTGLGLYALTAMLVPRPEARQSFIVQAGSLPGAIAAVGEASGLVTHKLEIIQAVAAELTDEQRQALTAMPEIQRVWSNRTVYTAGPSCPVNGSRALWVDGKKIEWYLTNRGTQRVDLDDFMVEWPEANGGIVKISLSGDFFKRYAAPSSLHLDRGWDGSRDARKIDGGQTKRITIEFEHDADPAPDHYFLEARFGEGCAVVLQPPPEDCPLVVDAPLLVASNKLYWPITNIGSADMILEDLYLEWPILNGDLDKITLTGGTIFREWPGTSLDVAGNWNGNEHDRTIEPGKTEELRLQFENDGDPWSDHYTIQADFGGGCSLNLERDGIAGVAPSDFSVLIGADRLHSQGFTGDGVSVAVVDTGVWGEARIKKNRRGDDRLKAGYNAIDDREGVDRVKDHNGHGTHVASLIANSERWEIGLFAGVAPDADLVIVQAFDHRGRGSYADAIRGIDWVVQNRDLYGVRVLNLSFSAEPQSYYWDDPLNQAVMAAWQAGIVVVASAGNGGPDPMTIGVPGNVPYVITVGAMSDAVTPVDSADDFLTSFSAAGPTVEGFVKPELVAPGGHLRGVMDRQGRIANDHPEFHDRGKYFLMSGTSQAAAVTSGVVALLLQAEPGLAPDEVKCRLMASARPALTAQGDLAYSVFQQGAGMVHALDAALSNDAGCANQGLDLDLDLAGVQHFGGRANRDEQGNYYVMGLDGYLWSGGYLWSEGYLWSGGYLWSEGYLWSGGYLWSEGYAWSDSYPFSTGGYLWSEGLTETMSVNTWVPQE